MKPNHGLDHGTMGAVPHTITLQGGPHHGETRPVEQAPTTTSYAPDYYYAFHKLNGEWEPTAIYIQDPFNPRLFHYLADAKDHK